MFFGVDWEGFLEEACGRVGQRDVGHSRQRDIYGDMSEVGRGSENVQVESA